LTHTKHLDLKLKSEPAKESILISGLKQTPFPLVASHGRQYLRIEMNSDVQFRLLTCKKGKLKLSRDRMTAEILNLSEGGVLLSCDHPVVESDFVLLTLCLNQLVILEGILGKVKRVEASEEGDYLIGVEFSPKEELEKLSAPHQMENLPVKVASFDRRLREIIANYLRTTEFISKQS
jgi:hypothetical protein